MSKPRGTRETNNKLPKLKYVEFRWSVGGNEEKQQHALHSFIKSICSKFIYQLENTETDGKDNYHYQGYGELILKRRSETIKSLAIQSNGQFNGIRIEPASTTGREALKKYCLKSETRVAGPWSDQKVYMGQDLPGELWDWQQDVKSRCMSASADDRVINYIIDLKGNMGKSKFCKYMCYHHKALMLPWGRTGDILNLVVKKGPKDIYLFDLSRAKPQDWAKDDISAAMEQIKNGHIVNLKYETDDFMMCPPHVWCFSNSPPNLTSMSLDRWKFWEITGSRQLVSINSVRLKQLSGELHSNGGSSTSS